MNLVKYWTDPTLKIKREKIQMCIFRTIGKVFVSNLLKQNLSKTNGQLVRQFYILIYMMASC